MYSSLAELRDSLSWTRRSFRNQTMEARRIPAALEGSEGRRGLRGRGDWRGFDDTVDLKDGFAGERKEEERERCEREGSWEGILTLLG